MIQGQNYHMFHWPCLFTNRSSALTASEGTAKKDAARARAEGE